jgi:hypothetical protein
MTSPLLEAPGVVKHYGRVQALRGADFADAQKFIYKDKC